MVEESFTLLVADKLKKGCRALMKYGKQIVWSSRNKQEKNTNEFKP